MIIKFKMLLNFNKENGNSKMTETIMDAVL